MKISLILIGLCAQLFLVAQKAEMPYQNNLQKEKLLLNNTPADRLVDGLTHFHGLRKKSDLQTSDKRHERHHFTGPEMYSPSALKSGNIIRKKLDSMIGKVWDNYENWGTEVISRADYSYDINGKTDTIVWYILDKESEKMVQYSKREYFYNNPLPDYYILYMWDTITSAWINSSKFEYKNDTLQRQLIDAKYIWDKDTGRWIGSYKNEYAYDANGRQILDLTYLWNISPGNWQLSSAKQYKFNENSDSLNYDYYTWDTETNKKYGISKFSRWYDINGLLRENLDYTWDIALAKWVNSVSTRYVYDSNGLKTEENKFIWDDSIWIKKSHDVFIYDNEGILKESFGFDVDLPAQIARRTEYTYNANGKLISQGGFLLDKISGILVLNNVIENTYYWDGNLHTHHEYNFDSNTGEIVGGNFYELAWDEENDRIYQKINYNWNDSTKQWIPVWKYYNSHDLGFIQTEEYNWDENHGDWKGISMTDSLFDDSGILQELSYYYWSDKNWNWTGTEKHSLIYNNSGLISEIEVAGWTYGRWVEWKEDYTYDEKGNISFLDWSDTHESGTWEFDGKAEVLYETAYDTLNIIYSYWDEDIQKMMKDDKDVYVFNEKGKLVMLTLFYWNDKFNDWMVYAKSEYAYNSEEMLDQEIHYHRFADSLVLENNRKYEYSYNENNYLIQETSFDWNSGRNEWNMNWKETYSYNLQNAITMTERSSWYNDTETWQVYNRDEYQYAADGTILEILTTKRNYETQLLEDLSKGVFTYDPAYGFENFIIPKLNTDCYFEDYVEYFNYGMLTSLIYYDWDTEKSAWNEHEVVSFNYSDFSVPDGSISARNDDVIKIYPNPANDFLNLLVPPENISDQANLQIYSIDGCKIMEKKIELGDNVLNIADLDRGSYIVIINLKSGQYLQRFVKL